ncbi:MAG: M48 family metallopeptidase [Pseudobdellovibrionaceae bacterium]|nr:M48 family metallopeptidase [Pseudobdellovibrionaceae bacterium]
MVNEKKLAIEPYKHELPLFYIGAVISTIVWIGIIYGTKGVAAIAVPFVFIFYLFAQSAFVSYLKGSGALVSTRQFPEIHQAVVSCSQKIGLKDVPNIYILHLDGMFNAFALRFLHKQYVVLLSDVVDAMDNHPDALNFYIGHEMAHLHRNHSLWNIFLLPSSVLPLLGAAHSRACESTCDIYGAACCEKPESARLGLAALAVGGKKYSKLDIEAYIEQVKETKGFWMSFHELVGNYPWLTKRFARVGKISDNIIPKRHPLAYVFAIFVPKLSITSLIVIYILFIVIMSASALNPFLGAMNDSTYESQYSSVDGQGAGEETYVVGQEYEGDAGYFYEYLGGDPFDDASWKLVRSPEDSSEPEQDDNLPEGNLGE